jgi:hypothetical protein
MLTESRVSSQIVASHDRLKVGESFYMLLLSRYPQLLSVFGSTDMERQVSHFVDMVELIVDQCGVTFGQKDKKSPTSNVRLPIRIII